MVDAVKDTVWNYHGLRQL